MAGLCYNTAKVYSGDSSMSKNADNLPNDAVFRFLKREYAGFNMTPQVMTIDNRPVIIPCFYIRSSLEAGEAKKKFVRDYFSRQYRDIARYKDAGLQPRKIVFNGGTFVVPFDERDSDKKDCDIADGIMRSAYRDYRRAAAYMQKLNECGIGQGRLTELGLDNIENMEDVYNRYLWEKAKDKAAAFGAFMAKGAKSAYNGAKILLQRADKAHRIRIGADRFCQASRKAVIGAALTTLTLTGGLYAHQQLQEKQKEKAKDKTEKLSKAEVDAREMKAAVMPEVIKPVEGQRKVQAKKKVVSEKRIAVNEKAEQIKVGIKEKTLEKTAVKKGKLPQKIRAEYGLDDEKFQRFMGVVFKHEGGYRNVSWDYPTQMGITSITLKNFWKNNKKLAEELDFPTAGNIKNLNKEQCELIYKKDFYDYYRIGDFKNESIALLLFDIRVNHSSKTASQIIANGIYEARGRKNVRRTDKIVELANGIAGKAKNEQYFYDHMVKARIDFINKHHKRGGEKTNDYNGLMNRAGKFKGKFVATLQQDNNLRLAMYDARGR